MNAAATPITRGSRNARFWKLRYMILTVIALGTLAVVTDAVQARATNTGDSTQDGWCEPTPCDAASIVQRGPGASAYDGSTTNRSAYASGPVPALPLMSVATTANQSYAGAADLLATLLVLLSGMASGLRQHSLL